MSAPQVGDTIATAEKLDALPNFTAIANHLDVGQKVGGLWRFPETRPLPAAKAIKYGPVTIVYLPGRPPRPERVVKAEALREAATHAWVLERATDPTTAAFHWLRGVAHRIERNEP